MSTALATVSVGVLNATYVPLGATKLARALALVFDGRAVIEEEDPSRRIRSKGRDVPMPLVIRLLTALKVPFTVSEQFFSKRGVLQRDKYKCGYCLGPATTHDHIVPRSKGGPDSWENAISACTKCNGKKADRTPEEAGMPLLFKPTIPTRIYLRSEKKPRKKNKKR